MNKLELAQRLAMEATRGAGPSTTTGQTYENGRFVKWIETAYETIQNLKRSWEFLRTDFSFNTIASVQNYTKASIPLEELGSWRFGCESFKCYLTSTGVAGETWLQYYPWEDFRRLYMFGSNQSIEGRPIYFTIKPNKSVSLWPIPDAEYTISGEYFKRAQTLDEDGDEPLIPDQYHMIIVWLALMYYGQDAAAPEKFTAGQLNYKMILSQLINDQLPEFEIDGGLV